ncbi:unnamed protein product [Sphagnum jensenii]|uniref:Alpha-(1,6)-fucosyltransferase N- and catalytic domain-containing protein n=1 Tax=Sphagnum jensenii TaxID=128206 RepID=A0ABP1C290_9BRYO
MLPFSMMQQGVPGTSRGGCGTATSVRRLILQAIVMIGCGLGVIVVGQRLCLVSTCGPEHHRDVDTPSHFTISNDSVAISPVTAEMSIQEAEEDIADTKCEPELFPSKYWTGQRLNQSAQVTNRQPGQAMFGTIAAQRDIWKYQHPNSCENQKFLVYVMLDWEVGIGSMIHVTTAALGVALETGRILVLYPTPNLSWVKGVFCEDYDTLDTCYFEPITSCPVYDIFGGKLEKLDDIPEIDLSGNVDQSHLTVLRAHPFMVANSWPESILMSVPDQFRKLLLMSGMPEYQWYHWWRAQAVTYIVRPNRRTLLELDSRRRLLFPHKVIDPGTISIHVRHGDKWMEDTLVDDEVHLRLAEELLEKFPDIAKRNIFLSTADPKSVQFFAKLTNWNVSWTNLSRVDDATISPMDRANRLGWTEEFLNSLLDLGLALECDAFVGMYSSNWNRLIDELRSTVRCKAHFPYVDVHQGWSISNYNW